MGFDGFLEEVQNRPSLQAQGLHHGQHALHEAATAALWQPTEGRRHKTARSGPRSAEPGGGGRRRFFCLVSPPASHALSKSRVEEWRGGLGAALRVTGPFGCRCPSNPPCPVSTPRSSNRPG